MSTSSASGRSDRWLPSSEDDIAQSAAAGLLEETHYLDLKREVKPGKGANTELARDLAQFAIDGGALLIGVEEVKDSPPAVAPVVLEGLSERVEQVGVSRCDPPLQVSCTPIPSSSDPSRGYLLVRVPASGLAPHMVDGTYYARGDKTRTRLSDAEVLRMHATRHRSQDVVNQLLDDYIARDPVPVEQRRQARLYFVAAPVIPRHEMLLDVVSGENRHALIRGFITEAAAVSNRSAPAPDLQWATTPGRRPDGIAVTSGLDDGRRPGTDGQGDPIEDILEVEFTDEGTVRVLHTHMSDEVRPGRVALFEGGPVVLTRQGVQLAAAVGTHAGYGGGWLLGVAVTGIAGLPAYLDGSMGHGQARIDQGQDEYRATVSASSHQLESTPGAVAQRLVGRFLRSLGIEHRQSVQEALADS